MMPEFVRGAGRRRFLSVAAFPAAAFVLAAAFAGVAAAPAAADDAVVVARYDVYLNGLKLGDGAFRATMTGAEYTIKGNSRLTGIAGALLKISAAGHADGRFVGDEQSPTGFSATSVSGDRTSTVQMAIAGKDVATLIAKPETDTAGKVRITRAHQRGIIDPMSAMLKPMSARGPVDPSNCEGTLPIFNGRERFDVVLSYKRTAPIDSVAKAGGATQAIVCQARYRPISGHRAGKKEVEYFANQTGIELWLVQAGDTGMMVPYRITLPTPIGQGVVQLGNLLAKGNTRFAMR